MPRKRSNTGLFRVEVAGVSDRHGVLRREGDILVHDDDAEDDDRSVHLDDKLGERLFKKGAIRELTEDEADDYKREVGPAHVDPRASELTTGNETPRGVGEKGERGDLEPSGGHSDPENPNDPTDNSEEALRELGIDELKERARALNIEGRSKLDKEGLIVAILASVG